MKKEGQEVHLEKEEGWGVDLEKEREVDLHLEKKREVGLHLGKEKGLAKEKIIEGREVEVTVPKNIKGNQEAEVVLETEKKLDLEKVHVLPQAVKKK